MTPKEKALELYTKFQSYYWHEVDGYMPDDKQTKKLVYTHCDEIIENLMPRYDDFTMALFYADVKREVCLI